MRFVDVACATSFGVISLLVLSAINPAPMHEESTTLLANARAGALVQDYLARYGLNFLATSSLAEICASALSYSNQSARLLVSVDGAKCPDNEASGAFLGTSLLTLELGGRSVTIEAWVRE